MNDTSAGMDSGPALIARLDAWLSNSSARHERESAACAAESPQTFDLQSALYAAAWTVLSPEVGPLLDRLRRKIEVARKLYRYYAADLSQAAAEPLLPAGAVQRLCVLLLKAAFVWRDARYLNSALKLLDGVLGPDDCAFPEELRVFATEVLDELAPNESAGR